MESDQVCAVFLNQSIRVKKKQLPSFCSANHLLKPKFQSHFQRSTSKKYKNRIKQLRLVYALVSLDFLNHYRISASQMWQFYLLMHVSIELKMHPSLKTFAFGKTFIDKLHHPINKLSSIQMVSWFAIFDQLDTLRWQIFCKNSV